MRLAEIYKNSQEITGPDFAEEFEGNRFPRHVGDIVLPSSYSAKSSLFLIKLRNKVWFEFRIKYEHNLYLTDTNGKLKSLCL
jgi:hypothetical protein